MRRVPSTAANGAKPGGISVRPAWCAGRRGERRRGERRRACRDSFSPPTAVGADGSSFGSWRYLGGGGGRYPGEGARPVPPRRYGGTSAAMWRPPFGLVEAFRAEGTAAPAPALAWRDPAAALLVGGCLRPAVSALRGARVPAADGRKARAGERFGTGAAPRYQSVRLRGGFVRRILFRGRMLADALEMWLDGVAATILYGVRRRGHGCLCSLAWRSWATVDVEKRFLGLDEAVATFGCVKFSVLSLGSRPVGEEEAIFRSENESVRRRDRAVSSGEAGPGGAPTFRVRPRAQRWMTRGQAPLIEPRLRQPLRALACGGIRRRARQPARRRRGARAAAA